MKNRTTARRIASCESLENRRMFITYQVDGTSGNDSISISISGNSIISVVNGASDSGSDIINNNIEINGLGGNDTITIVETGANTVVVNAGSGNDTVNVGTGDLDVIDDTVTVNGDTGTDVVNFNDQSDPAGNLLQVISGNLINRPNMPQATVNAESVALKGGPNTEFTIFGNPNFDIDLIGLAVNPGFMLYTGTGSQLVVHMPSGVTTGSGVIDIGAHTIDYSNLDLVKFLDLANLLVNTPNSSDSLVLTRNTTTIGELSGTSGGVALTNMTFSSVDTLQIDMRIFDAASSTDLLQLTLGLTGASQLELAAGETGTDTLNVLSGTWSVSSSMGTATGENLNTTLTGASVVNFVGPQELFRLQVDNGSAANFTGPAGSSSTIRQLAVANGSGTIGVNSGLTASVIAGALNSFALGNSRVINKTGGGTLNINATQSHGTSSAFNSSSGTTNFNSDAGSAAARRLDVDATQSTVNFNTTQHLDFISTGIGGLLRMNPNGQRVLVCSNIFVDTEGSAIDLTNNNLILDYSGASQLSAVQTLLTNGFAGGNWNGIGLTSATANANAATTNKTALGFADATDLFNTFPASFVGESIDSTSVLVRHTYYGDGNLNRTVNSSDFNVLATGFGTTGKRWFTGNFNYDGPGGVNSQDFNLLATNFGLSLPGEQARPGSGGGSGGDSIFGDGRTIGDDDSAWLD